MTKETICNEIILQFSKLTCFDYKKFDTGPEFGVIFYSKLFNKEIRFTIGCWDSSDNFFIDFRRNTFFCFFKGINHKNFSVNKIFQNDNSYKRISKIINDNNYKQVIADNIIFLKTNLERVTQGEIWIGELLKQKKQKS